MKSFEFQFILILLSYRPLEPKNHFQSILIWHITISQTCYARTDLLSTTKDPVNPTWTFIGCSAHETVLYCTMNYSIDQMLCWESVVSLLLNFLTL